MIRFDITDDFTIEDLGFQDVWVYDIEVEDTHTFFANDILVHNSNYVTLNQWVVKYVPEGKTIDETVSLIDDFVDKHLEPEIERCYDILSNYLNAKENLLIMKREAIADCAIFRGKKNYIINVYDNEHVRFKEPKLKMMGIETARTSTPMIVRKELEKCLKLLIKNDKDGIKKEVVDFKQLYFNRPLEDIAIPRGVSDIDKWLSSTGSCLSGTPIHVRAAINYNNMINADPELKKEYPLIKNGTKIKFIKLLPNNPVGSHVIAYVESLPDKWNMNKYINRPMLFEDTFLSPLESFADLVGWNLRHTEISVNSFFSGDNTINLQPISTQQQIEMERPKKKIKNNSSTLNMTNLFQ